MNKWLERHYSAPAVAERKEWTPSPQLAGARSGTVYLLGREDAEGIDRIGRIELTFDAEVGGWDNMNNNDFDTGVRSRPDPMMLVFESKPNDPNKRPEEQPWPTIRLTYGDPK